MATHFRSTWLVATLQLLREHGLYDAYFRELPVEHREPIAHSIAGLWLPIDVALAHYRALDALEIPPAQVTEFGRLTTTGFRRPSSGRSSSWPRTSGPARGPIYARLQRLWARIFRGSAVAVFELGPKEARLEVAGWPCASSTYVHSGLVGVISGLTELFAQRAYVRELHAYRGPRSLAYRASWV